MRFIQGTPPPRMYYFSDTDNDFDVNIELRNDGASHTIGGLYISGYDPNLIMIEGVDVQEFSIRDCTFDLGNINFGSSGQQFAFHFDCFGFEGTRNGPGDWDVRKRDIGNLFGWRWLDEQIDIGFGYDGGTYDIDFEWDSFGSADLLIHGKALILALSSLSFEIYNGKEFALKGDNYESPGGETGFVDWRGHITHNWPTGVDEIDQTFLVTSCYAYTTFAAPNICVDPQPYSETRKVCTPKEITYSGHQGAPVAITKIQQMNTPRSVVLTFYVKNVGGGEVFSPGYLERCSPWFPDILSPRYKDEIYIGRISVGDQHLDCNPGYSFRLQNGQGTFTCTYDMEYATASSAYETPVVAELWYGYQETIQRTVRIKRAS
jgi:hypothetical protein